MDLENITHDGLADWCAKRLTGMGYPYAWSNLTSASHGELPDVLGVTAWGKTIMVEVKVSRSDFLADKNKPWRKNPEMGMGDYRVYLAPEGIIKPDEVPYGWSLWEIYGKKKPMLRIVKGLKQTRRKDENGNWRTTISYPLTSKKEYNHFKSAPNNARYALTWMIKFLHRASKRGYDITTLANHYQLKK